MTVTERLPPLPWEEVNARPAPEVARLLGLTPARERGKFACPVHGGSDSLHAYKGDGAGFYCFSGCQRAYSNVDLAAAVWGMTPADTCKRLADLFGILYERTLAGAGSGERRSAPRSSAAPPPRPAPARPPAPEPAEDPAAIAARQAVYAAVLERLTLGTEGRAFLAGRGFHGFEELAAADGFRSLDGLEGWRALWRALRRDFPDAALDAVLRPPKDDGSGERYALPFGGRAPVLVLPYRYRGEVVGLRFRNLAPRDKRDRYRDLGSRRPPMPFNADALEGAAGQELHVVEGELNAWTLKGAGLRAVGLPGAATPWRPTWTPLVRDVARLVAWYDADKGGQKGAANLAAALQAELGGAWLERHGRKVTPPADPNQLLIDGTLYDHIDAAGWR